MRWVWRLVALGVLLVGWLFIAWQNHFHISAPMVIVCIAFFAVVATVYNLWHTGAAAVATDDGNDDSTWARPTGLAGELEREKRTLLKAIKEAEFDHEMGKLSKRDADEMIAHYRTRAIEVIKELDRLALGSAGNVRQQIMREVRARLEVEAAKPPKKKGKKAKPAAKSDVQVEAKPVPAAEPEADDEDEQMEADSTTTEGAREVEAKATAAKPETVVGDESIPTDSAKPQKEAAP